MGNCGVKGNGDIIFKKDPKTGKLQDREGRTVNERGYLIDKNGNVISKNGQRIFSMLTIF